MAGAEWLNRYVSIEKEATFGTEPADNDAAARASQIYGEVDDESFKQTFDLLVRSDMSRQVASKAVTNTKYGEGSINLAVQPDNFMGNLMASFFPKRKHSAFLDAITFANRGAGYFKGTGKISDVSETPDLHIGYWEVRNGAQGTQDAANASAAAFNGEAGDVLTLDSTPEAGWSTVNGAAVSTTNVGFGILGVPGDGTTNTGFYFTYGGVTGDTLTHIKIYTNNTFTTAVAGISDMGAIKPVLQYYNGTKNHGVEPGRVYGYVTNPLAATSAVTLAVPSASADNDFIGLSSLDQTGGALPTTASAAVGGTNKHIFLEPTLATESYPSYTIRVGRESKEHTFTGMVSTRLSLSANLNEYVMASVDWLGQAEANPTAIQTSVGYSGFDLDALHFSGAELYIDGLLATTVKIQSVSLEININRDLDSAYAVGSNTIQRIPPSRTREITGSMEFNEILYDGDNTLLGEPTYNQLAGTATGSSNVHKIQGGIGRPALKFQFQDGTKTDFIEVNLFNVRFEAPEASVSGRDPARMSVGFQAFFDSKEDGSQKSIEVKMKGSKLQASDY